MLAIEATGTPRATETAGPLLGPTGDYSIYAQLDSFDFGNRVYWPKVNLNCACYLTDSPPSGLEEGPAVALFIVDAPSPHCS